MLSVTLSVEFLVLEDVDADEVCWVAALETAVVSAVDTVSPIVTVVLPASTFQTPATADNVLLYKSLASSLVKF